jgi:hypothetical protein
LVFIDYFRLDLIYLVVQFVFFVDETTLQS